MTLAPYVVAGIIALLTVVIYAIEYRTANDAEETDPSKILKHGVVAGIAAMLALQGAQYFETYKIGERATTVFLDKPKFT